MLTFEEALATVREKIGAAPPASEKDAVALAQARGRVLAEDVAADRDYPPFHRSTRDGFAVRAADVRAVPVTLELLGEVRAGSFFAGQVTPGHAVQIMTGAPLPEGADAVVMLEYARVEGSRAKIERAVEPWENVVGRGSEAAAGNIILSRGRRLGAGEIGLLASVGKAEVQVFRPPRVAILPTGDEVVSVEQTPEWFEIRNSNSFALGAQVEAAGGVPCPVGIARDDEAELRRMILQGLEADLLLLSGGVSAGKYDLVERVLAELGAEFYFTSVAIRPGKPLVFGRVRNKFFFGLPGNPVSTYVTFEMFARPAIALLGGGAFEAPVFLRARLRKPFRQKTGLTVFMPARVERAEGDPTVDRVGWQGSGDLVGIARANAFLVVHPEQTELEAGDWVDVLPKEQ